MLKRISSTISKYNMLNKHDKLVVAVSGGADSICLLLVLLSLKKDYKLELYIAHLNHGLRRIEAKKDADFVARLAKKYKLPVSFKDIDVPGMVRQKKGSPEDIAREARYKFLLDVAKNVGAEKIALGHTMDDQAETVLLRLLRGCGLLGLGGIAPLRKIDKFLIIRPLIEISRKQIESHLRKRRITPRRDSSNLKQVYRRNKVRLKLIPYLEKNYNPKIKEVLVNMAEGLRADSEWLQHQANEIFADQSHIKKNCSCLILYSKLKKAPEALRRHLLRLAIKKVKGDLKDIEYRHWKALEKFYKQSSRDTHLDLPHNIRVKKTKTALSFEVKQKTKKDTRQLEKPIKLNVPGQTKLPALKLTINAELLEKYPSIAAIRKEANMKYMDTKRLKFPLVVRTRRIADRFKPLGMEKEIKLKDFFINSKVLKDLRNSIPLVLSRKKIVCVGNLRVSEDVKISKKTTQALRLNVKKY